MKKFLLIYSALFITFFVSSQTQSFHDTQGKLEISNSGSATYTLPIAMPPSIQNVGPVINLIYSSGLTGGIAGQGWSINSISTISRIGTRRDLDGFIDGVDFDDNDKLALDGQRLLIKTGTYWADNAIYQTETQSNSIIQQFGTGTNIYFVVTAADGSRSWYGNYGGVNAVDNTAFYITRFEDTNGNYITYDYYRPYNKSLCILKIDFSANSISNITPQNYIYFNYKLAKRWENAFIKGVKQERMELLDNIDVFTNGNPFRKYQLTHVFDTQLGYEKVSKIQESNGAGELANPVEFTYQSTVSTNVNSETTKSYNNNINFQDIKLSGDFDGDGRLDFVTNDKMYVKNFEFNTTTAPINVPLNVNNRTCLVGTTLNTSNKLNQHQSIIHAFETTANISFKIYDLIGGTLTFTNEKIISKSNTGIALNCTNFGPSNGTFTYQKDSNLYYEGDFNGDGKSDVLMISTFNEKQINGYSGNTGSCIPIVKGNDGVQYSIIEISDSQFSGFYPIINSYIIGDAINTVHIETPANNVKNNFRYINDFNGDGKSDLLIINPISKSYKIISFNNIDAGSLPKTMEVLGNGVIDAFSDTKQMLFGDYNGDGKTDFMLPDTEGGEGHTLWHIYYSNPNPNGGSFFTKESHNIVEYRPNTGSDYDSQTHLSNYYALDVNKDGKTDMVRVWRKFYKPGWTINDHDTQWSVTTFVNNIGNTLITGNKFTLDYVSPCASMTLGNDPHTGMPIIHQICNHNSDSPDLPIPIASTYRYNGMNRELLMVRNHTNEVTYIKFTKDVSNDILLNKVSSSGGEIVDEIEYANLEPSVTADGLGLQSDFYSSGDSVNYPNVEIKRLPASNVVSKLKNTSLGVSKYQDFRYHGFVTNMDGMGALGFSKTARTAWYTIPSTDRMWSVTENNPLLRGAMVRSYSASLKTWNLFSFVSSGIPLGIINSITNTYVADVTNGIFTIYLNTHITEDYTTKVKAENTYTYWPTFFLEKTLITKNYLNNVLQGTSNTLTEYNYNPTGTGSDYFVGKPSRIVSSVNAYNDTFSTEDKFTYTGSRLTKTEKKANNADGVYLTEEFEYFANGNIKKKTLTAPGATPAVDPRITEFTYDTSERFIKTSKDIEKLVSTNDSFDPLYGLVTKTIDPFGLSTLSVYDNWGKRIKIIDYLGKSTNFAYTKVSGVYTTLQTADNGLSSEVKSDALGRIIREGSKNINGNWSFTTTEYDFMNRKTRKSEPNFSTSSPAQWSSFIYDEYSRIIQTIAHTGLTTNISYNGLTVTTNDGTKTSTATKNANGHTVSTSDNGGTVLNTYYANGNLKTATYDNTQISLEYDGWGRKIKLVDPSAGMYQYEYNIFGETTKEIAPKGITTYDLLSTGRLNFKTTQGTNGDTTNSKTTFTYYPATKLVKASRFDDFTGGFFTNYTYGYDTFKRLNFKDESSTLAYYQQATQFDEFGRPEKVLYTSMNTADGKRSDKWIKNTYKNGFAWQIIDNATNQVLWQTNTVNARAQVQTASLGNGTAITNTYDQYGYVTQLKHDKTGANTGNIMTLNTVFDIVRGNLNSRSNSLFNWNETFAYDSLDRLTHYKNAAGYITIQIYEPDGRIKFNNDQGVYNYENESKKYQNTSIKSTKQAFPFYTNRAGIFNDSMESTTGWIINDPTIGWDYSTAKTGAVSLKIPNTTTVEKVVQSTLWTKIDNGQATQYTYSGWVKGTGAAAELVLYMKTATETGAYTQVDQIISSTGTNWAYFEKTVLVPANIKNLKLRLDNNGLGTVWFDDVRIRKTSDIITAPKELNITYNSLNSPVTIEEANIDKITFEYNQSDERSTMYYGGLQADKTQRQYIKSYSEDGTMEIKQNKSTGTVEFITYIGGDGYSAPIVLKSDGTTQEYLYLHRDYQGSIVAITNQAAVVVEKRLFDAWGQVLKIQDAQGNCLSQFSVLDRGYTGHEHLQSVGIIHMNGRIYDPKLHRFLQTDSHIQDPSNTQNYNRYGYCWNNPLKYTDPSGEVIHFLAAVIIGAAISALTYTVTALLADVPFSVGGLLQSAAIGAFSAVVTFGIGEACSAITNFYTRATTAALTHGTFQGMMSGVQGGNFWSGFAAGCLASIASSAWQGGSSFDANGDAIAGSGWAGAGKFADSTAGLLAFGAVSGGAGASLTGGNFWQGAVTGLVVSGLNHAMDHSGENNKAARAVKHLKGKPTPGNEAIQTVVDIDDLDSDYSSGGSPKVGNEIKYVANAPSADFANTDMSNGNISVYKKSYTSWKTLYSKVAHELSHRFDYKSLSYAGWVKSYGKDYARAVSETYAYDREAWWDGGNQGIQLNSFSEAAKARSYNLNFQPKWRQ